MNALLRLSLILLSFVAINSSAYAQWTKWSVSEGGNDHWYRPTHVPAPISWLTASNLARASGGYLATINSAEENSFVFKLIDKPVFWNGELGPLFGGYQVRGAAEPGGGWLCGRF